MDEFEKRLKQDAQDIEAKVRPQLRERIHASLRATKRIKPVPEARSSGINIWWASSLTGLAATIIVIVLLNWNRTATVESPPEPLANHTVPEFDELHGFNPPKLIRTAELTMPLEQELAKLQADMERARAAVKKDIEFTF